MEIAELHTNYAASFFGQGINTEKVYITKILEINCIEIWKFLD